MNNLVIPPSPNWYESRVLTCAIDNTVIYGAQNEIIIINPTKQSIAADIRIFPPAHYARVISVDVNSNWGPGNKLVVSAGEDKIIHLWNCESYSLQSTNTTHTTQTEKLIGSVFMGIDKIVSVSENGFISLWRFKSNETTTFKNIFGFKSRITTLSPCPHLSWMMAFGFSCGLVVITDLRKTGRVIYKLRGHDKSIVSLAWCPTPFNVFYKNVSSNQKTSSEVVKQKIESHLDEAKLSNEADIECDKVFIHFKEDCVSDDECKVKKVSKKASLNQNISSEILEPTDESFSTVDEVKPSNEAHIEHKEYLIAGGVEDDCKVVMEKLIKDIDESTQERVKIKNEIDDIKREIDEFTKVIDESLLESIETIVDVDVINRAIDEIKTENDETIQVISDIKGDFVEYFKVFDEMDENKKGSDIATNEIGEIKKECNKSVNETGQIKNENFESINKIDEIKNESESIIKTDENESITKIDETNKESNESINKTGEIKNEDEAIIKTDETKKETDESVNKADKNKKEDEAVIKTDETKKETDELVNKTDENKQESNESINKTDEIKSENEAIIKTDEIKKESNESINKTDETKKESDESVNKIDEVKKEIKPEHDESINNSDEIKKEFNDSNRETVEMLNEINEFINGTTTVMSDIQVSKRNLQPVLDTNRKVEGSKETTPPKEYLLASSARGGSICIWRAGTDGRKQTELSGRVYNKGKNWKSPDKSWISLCWIAPEILLSSSITAELIQWNLLRQGTNKGPEKKLVHHDHNGNLFVIAAPITLIPEWKNEIKRKHLFAWTTGQERYLLNTSLQADRTIIASYPTIGGHIYSLKSSPLDPSRLAIGIGDNTAKIWDISRPHKQCITMTHLWQKIQSKVLALAWHPKKETIVAYGTAEGRVGTINSCTKNSNLFCQYFRNAVYDIEWGPIDSNVDNLGLYAVGEGKLVVYNTSKENEDPNLVNSKVKEHIQCLAWKSDYSLLACGTKTGSILIYNISLNRLITIYSDYKSIYSIVWHPLATAYDEGTSPMSSWLAISSSCTSVVVFDLKMNQEEGDKNTDYQKIVLNRHTKPVRCVCWSPYIGGRIASGGDDGVIHVWDVKNQLVLSTFIEHNADPVFAILWSPLDENFIISGGRNNVIRVWNVNEHKPKTDEEIKKSLEIYLSFRFNKKQSNKDKDDDDDQKEVKVQRGVMLKLASKAQNIPENALNDCVRLFKKLNPDQIVDIEEKDTLTNDFDILKIFSDKDDMLGVLNAECKSHREKKKYQQSQHIDLWKGDVMESLTNAISEGNVTPWLINLAAMVSIDLWKKACETYAKKLVEDAKSDPIETASYLLMCHKVEEAIYVLCNATLYREALALATCRLSKNDPIIKEILNKWATYGVLSGAYEVSTQCFVVLGQYEEAAKVLFKRSDVDSLKFAVVLAEKSGNKDLIDACTARFNIFKSINAAGNEKETDNKNSFDSIPDVKVENVELAEEKTEKEE